MVEAGLANLLATNAGIQAALGTRSGSDTGVYPVLLPENPQYPALTYQIVSWVGDATLETSGMQRARAQLDCFGETYSDAVTLRAAAAAALNGYRGTLSDGTLLQNALALQRIDLFEDAPRVYRASIEFYLFFDL